MNTGLRIICVSTGRCGTTRLAEILSAYLPGNCMVVHQTHFSRLANVIGNIQYHLPVGEALGNYIYCKMIKSVKADMNYISADPLSPMIVPRAIIESEKTHIIHIVRDRDAFAASMYRLTRKKMKSFIAHNFIPFWQPCLFPLENILSRKIVDKYRLIHEKKNDFLVSRFSVNPNFQTVSMEEIFKNNTLAELFSGILDAKVEIPLHELSKKTNQS